MLPSYIKALILDMDGVVWRSDTPIGELPSIFARMDARGQKYVFATNNGSRTPEQYSDKFKNFGVDIKSEQIVTSAICVAHMLAQKFAGRGKVFMIGGDGIKVALEQNGFEILPIENAQEAQALVMGIDWEITFQKMVEATLLVRRGVPFYATNPDKTFPTPRGEIPGAGAWTSVVTTATNVDPIYAGKPLPYIMDLALERLGMSKEETLVVGDRLETDIAAGQAVGCPTALVLSGVSKLDQAKLWEPKIDIIAESLESLVG
jgi:HAD superfamily hydrolase (TIGR01457 family)